MSLGFVRVASAFAALVLSVSVSFSQETERQIVTTPDADYFGFDLRTERDVTLDQCEAACLADPQCRAFTFNTRAQWCFLKTDFGRIDAFPGAVAGHVVETAMEPDLGAPPALSFLPSYMIEEARSFRSETLSAATSSGPGLAAIAAQADEALASGDAREAYGRYLAALGFDADRASLWTGLSRAALDARPREGESIYTFQRAATASAINAYGLSRTASDRAASLAALAAGLDKRSVYRAGITAYRESLALIESEEVRALYDDLRARRGFRIVGNTVDADNTSPRLCIEFSEELLRSGVDYADYLVIRDRSDVAVEASGRQLCAVGLSHGETYNVTVRGGLPSTVGEALEADADLSVYIRDRTPSARFSGDGFVLPDTMRRGIPVVSVNAASVRISIFRVGDRSIARAITEQRFLAQLDGWDLSQVGETLGAPVWEGELSVTPERNRDVVTSFPVDEALPERMPGVYVMSAVAEGDTSEEWQSRATQWFLVSDIGLTTFSGSGGLDVFVRSLATARPVGSVRLELLARNNEVLSEAQTDERGVARFDAGLLRGTGGMAPAVLVARSGDADYVFLDLTRSSFDFSDRGVEGRASPGPVDIFLATERGIYRAGDTVHVTSLSRDASAEAIEGLPLTFILRRPDGVEDRRQVSREVGAGGHVLALPLADNAMLGTWTLAAHTDASAAPVAERTFLVEDFVPDRIEFDLTADTARILPGQPVIASVAGRYLYGSPAAGLDMEGEIVLARTREMPGFGGYVFGLADEEDFEGGRVALENLPTTDAEGRAEIPVEIGELPSTTQLLKAGIVLRLSEAGGRAIERRLDIDVMPETDMIGIRPDFTEGAVAEGGNAGFSLLAVDPEGRRVESRGVQWTLTRIERDYQWYRGDSGWNYEPIESTTLVTSGELDLLATSEGRLSFPVAWGRYRLEVESADGLAATSIEFESGWHVAAGSTETPDALDIAFDKERYRVGETARLRIAPRFAGEALVALGADRIVQTFTASVDAAGTTIELPVTDEIGAGAYATVTLFRPGEASDTRMPSRAIGVRWLAVEPAERDLVVTLDVPETVRPLQTLAVPVSVNGASPGEEVHVTLAVVDVGILNLTRYEAPDPTAWYFGQRMLGLEMRDLYGRLIDGSLGAAGRIRTGGDGGGMRSEGSPPTEELVALFSGPVTLDRDGRATVPFDLPAFNGTVRVMAIAWSRSATGSAAQDVIVRDPVVLTTSMPRFLAPGDETRLLVEVANTDGPPGDYSVEVSGSGGVDVGGTQGAAKLSLAAGARGSVAIDLAAREPGIATLEVSLAGPDGTSITRSVVVPVRPLALPVTQTRTVSLAPGASLRIDRGLLDGSWTQDASVALSISPLESFDIPAILMGLDRYPYGCAEQTASRALPLLYLSELSRKAGLPDDPAVSERIDGAIKRVLANQSASGSFGLWSPGGGDLWLDAYLSDFLTRAREQGHEVPDQGMTLALQNLANAVAYAGDISERGAEIAYALNVLARNRKASAGDLRYYFDTQSDAFDTPMARAQIAASLSLYGDAQRASSGFAQALDMMRAGETERTGRSDYGSLLRDGAAMLALAAESRPAPTAIPAMVELVAGARDSSRWTSTQEDAWTLMAARALSEDDSDIRLEVDGAAHRGTFSRRLESGPLTHTPLTVVNRGEKPIDARITMVAAPLEPLPAGGDGFTIERAYFTLEGEPANVTEVRRNERFVTVLTMREENSWPSRVVVADLLPAGFEIDNPRLVGSAELTNFEWLGATEAVHSEFRGDRFIAAFDRSPSSAREFRLAYVVRAVTPGTYVHPAATVEDMYRPELSARTATGMMTVGGR